MKVGKWREKKATWARTPDLKGISADQWREINLEPRTE